MEIVMNSHTIFKVESEGFASNYSSPWNTGISTRSSATVTLVNYKNTNFLITNAHAVVNSTYLKLKLNTRSKDIYVKVAWLDPVIDLAVIEPVSPNDLKFFNDIKNTLLMSGEYQRVGTEVNAYGYPTGGENLSLTKGNISRTEIKPNSFSKMNTVLIQTSAPINPGNSGGPVTIKTPGNEREQCIGIVSSGMPGLSNVGFFIPGAVVQHVLTDFLKFRKLKEKNFIKNITVPHISLSCQELKNPVMRSYLGLPASEDENEEIGMYVTKIPTHSCAYGLIKEGDIIIAIDGLPVESNGTIKTPEIEHPINFEFLIQKKHYLDNINFTVKRKDIDNENALITETVSIRLTEQLGHSLFGITDTQPAKFYIQPSGHDGGYVFVACDANYMRSYAYFYDDDQICDTSHCPPMFNRFDSLSYGPDLKQVVILHSVFKAPETDGHGPLEARRKSGCDGSRVLEVNGNHIGSLNDLIKAFEDNNGKMSVVKFENGQLLCVAPAKEMEKTISKLKDNYRISFFASPKLYTQERKKEITHSVMQDIRGLGALENDNHIPSACHARKPGR